VFLKPHKGEEDETNATVGARMKENIADSAKKTGSKFVFPAWVTTILLVVAVIFMVLGWYDFDNVAESLIACIVAVFALIGLFSRKFKDAFERTFERFSNGYRKASQFWMRHKVTSFGAVIISIGLLVWFMSTTPTELVPAEDTGTLFCMVDMPPGTSQERTIETMDKVQMVLSQIPAIEYAQQIVGYSFIAGQGSTYGTFIIKLKNWSLRGKDESANAILGRIYAMTSQIVKDGRVVAFAPPMISGFGTTNGFEIKMQDRTGGDINEFYAIVQNFLAALNQRPEIAQAYTTFNPTFPQYKVDIDAAKVKQAGLSPSQILSALQGYYGGMYVSNFNRFGKIYRVMVQATPEARVSPETLESIKVRNAMTGEMASVSNFVTLERIYAPDLLNRFNMFTSISVTGTPANGFSSGQAL
ncbi:MAG: efflux RND transporter permease subunit, partial [Muribaculaceae bacterium]|nr:efflux RND transporter permease subunit [Muribaculaceae bacterium]